MNWFNNDKGFFQQGKSFGGRGLFGENGVLSGLADSMKPKPFAGVPGVCPYTGKPLQTPTEKATGVSDEARAQGAAPTTDTTSPSEPMLAPTTGKFGALNQELFKGLPQRKMTGYTHPSPYTQQQPLFGGLN